VNLAELREIAFKDQECKRAYDDLKKEFETLRKEIKANKKYVDNKSN